MESNMNIGDRVRLVHGREEGIIYAFLPGNVVEIEIEDGFRIPVLKNEIVTISPVESQRMKAETPGKVAPRNEAIVPRNAPFAEKGIYLAFISVNDRALTVHIVNNTDWTLPFTATASSAKGNTGLAAGVLSARSTQKLSEVLMKDFEEWPVFDFKVLYYRDGVHDLPQPLNKRIKCRAQSFYKNKGRVPVLVKDGFVYQLDEENLKRVAEPLAEDFSEELRSRMLEGAPVSRGELAKPSDVVDLHTDKLGINIKGLTNDAILKKQLDAFESNLERAIANGMTEITFIHGAGSGALKSELHRRLGKNQHVHYFKDALKEKFGYGATLVKIK